MPIGWWPRWTPSWPNAAPPALTTSLSRLSVRPVYTAHPTEASRRTALLKLREIADALIAYRAKPSAPAPSGSAIGASPRSSSRCGRATIFASISPPSPTRLAICCSSSTACLEGDGPETARGHGRRGRAAGFTPWRRRGPLSSATGSAATGTATRNVSPETTIEILVMQHAVGIRGLIAMVSECVDEVSMSTKLVGVTPNVGGQPRTRPGDPRNRRPDPAAQRRRPYRLKLSCVRQRLNNTRERNRPRRPPAGSRLSRSRRTPRGPDAHRASPCRRTGRTHRPRPLARLIRTASAFGPRWRPWMCANTATLTITCLRSWRTGPPVSLASMPPAPARSAWAWLPANSPPTPVDAHAAAAGCRRHAHLRHLPQSAPRRVVRSGGHRELHRLDDPGRSTTCSPPR